MSDQLKTEQMVLHAVEVWEQRMTPLFNNNDKGHQQCPYCPKRFIYGCFSGFERQSVEQVLEELIVKRALTRYGCIDHPEEYCYKKNG